MQKKELARIIDNSLLKNSATEKDVIEFCKKSLSYGMGVCVFPSYIELASKIAKGARIVSVIGYPTGMHKIETKVFEAKQAIRDGASELDMVMNISAFKSGNYSHVLNEIKSIVKAARFVKVIIETALLTDEEKIKACKLILKSGANCVKTSTGFIGGATVEDIRFIKKVVGDKLEIKASGGIRDLKTTLEMIKAGATRIGTSSGFKIMDEFSDKKV